jgi:hypothetical protein
LGVEQKKEVDLLQAILAKANSRQLLKEILKTLYHEQNLQLPELIKTFQEVKKEISIPLSIFSHHLHPAEALCKYLKENEGMSYQDIAQCLHRNDKSIWATYQRARKKVKSEFQIREEKYALPLSIFQNRELSFLESVVFYLYRIYRLSNKIIGKTLHKSPNSMAVLLKRALDKQGASKPS